VCRHQQLGKYFLVGQSHEVGNLAKFSKLSSGLEAAGAFKLIGNAFNTRE
jgi:hypothetical protein